MINRRTDTGRYIIISRHYHVAGYIKKTHNVMAALKCIMLILCLLHVPEVTRIAIV